MLFRVASTFAFVVSASLLACSSSSSDGSDGSDGNDANGGTTSGGPGSPVERAPAAPQAVAACTPSDAPKCSPARGVASAEAFLAEQKQLPWQNIASSKSGVLTLSNDLVADSDLQIDASTLSQSPDCSPDAGGGTALRGCGSVTFREDAWPQGNGRARVAGVGCAEERIEVRRGWGQLCSKLTIAKGTVFRIRNTVLDDHPSGYRQTVEIIAPCTMPCAVGEARCEATQMCLALGYSTCAYCEAKPVATCACRSACNADADNTKCGYDFSPDQPASGVCKAGSCVESR